MVLKSEELEGVIRKLQQGKHITIINLAHQKRGDIGAQQLAKALEGNKTPVTLNLMYNLI